MQSVGEASDAAFTRRLKDAGFPVEEVTARARSNGKGRKIMPIWFAGLSLRTGGGVPQVIQAQHRAGWADTWRTQPHSSASFRLTGRQPRGSRPFSTFAARLPTHCWGGRRPSMRRVLPGAGSGSGAGCRRCRLGSGNPVRAYGGFPHGEVFDRLFRPVWARGFSSPKGPSGNGSAAPHSRLSAPTG